MTPERLKSLNELARRVTQCEDNLKHMYEGGCSPTVRAKIDVLIQQDLEEQLAEARRQFERAA